MDEVDNRQHTPTPFAAIQMLIRQVDDQMQATRRMAELAEMTESEREHCEKIEVAISVVNAMLNTALVVARFRCFVQVDSLSILGWRINRTEYTICSPNIEGVIVGLMTLDQKRCSVYLQLWEQRPLGAEMLSGYQGLSKTGRYRSFVDSLKLFRENLTQN